MEIQKKAKDSDQLKKLREKAIKKLNKLENSVIKKKVKKR